MTLWKWWQETRGRFLTAITLAACLGWALGHTIVTDGPRRCIELRPGERPLQEWLVRFERLPAATRAQYYTPAEVDAIRRAMARCGANQKPGAEWLTPDGVPRYFARDFTRGHWGGIYTPVLVLLAIMFAVGGPATQRPDGTAPLTMSLPRTRARLLLEHAGWSALAALLLPLATLLVALAIAAPAGILPPVRFLLLHGGIALLFALGGVALATLASVLTRHLFGATLVALGFALPALWAQPLALDRYGENYAFVSLGAPQAVLSLLVVIVGTTALALIRFGRSEG